MISETLYKDLIDTLWNVKSQFWKDFKAGYFRFNRYIVECKELNHKL